LNLAGRRPKHRLNPQRHVRRSPDCIASLVRQFVRHPQIERGQLIAPALADPVQRGERDFDGE